MSYSRKVRRVVSAKGSAALAVLRSNRRGIRRKLGLTSQAVQCAETYVSLAAKKPRVGVSDVARVLGICRSQVSRHLARCVAAGLLVKIGRTFVLLAASVLSWSAEFAAQRRQACAVMKSKRWKALTKSRFVADGATHTKQKDLEQGQGSETDGSPVVLDRLEALALLRRDYVPVHLRKNA